jgi:hypothetical protein
MSTTRLSRFVNFFTFWIIPGCFVGCALAFYQDKDLTGWGLLITALLLRLSVIQYEQQKAAEQEAEQPVSDPADDLDTYDEDTFSIDLTTPYLRSQSGWENVVVYTKANTYRNTICFGGPPVLNEYWEYDIKAHSFGDDFVFQRLKDYHLDDLWDPRYEVVNGCVQQLLMESRYAETETKFYSLESNLADLRKKVEWHEADGAAKYLILSKASRSGHWRRQAEKLKESEEKIAVAAQQIGATLNEEGLYELPEDASEERKTELDKLFSPKTLRNVYGFRSYREWRERNHIFKLLEPEPTPVADH